MKRLLGLILVAILALTPAMMPQEAQALGRKDKKALAIIAGGIAVGAIAHHAAKAGTERALAERGLAPQAQPRSFFAPRAQQQPQLRLNEAQIEREMQAKMKLVRSAWGALEPVERRRVQARLSNMGYYSGSHDGIFGQRTGVGVLSAMLKSGNWHRVTNYNGAVYFLQRLAA